MKGKIEAIVLKEFANIFRKLDIADIRVEVGDKGWYAVMVDPGNVMIAEVLLCREAWKEYDFIPKTFAIDANRLYKYAADFKKGEIIGIEFGDTVGMEATFYLDGTLTRSFKLLEEEAVRAKPKIPPLEYRFEIVLLTPQIKVIKDILATKLEEWGAVTGIGVVERYAGEYELCLYAKDNGGIKNKACASLERAKNYLTIDTCASLYSHDLLKSVFALITKEVVATGTVTIAVGFQYPIKLSCDHKGLEVKQIILAPRVDKELTEESIYEDLRMPLVPVEEKVEIEHTEITLYFVPTAKGRLPITRHEYSDLDLMQILIDKVEEGLELRGLLERLKLNAIWRRTSYDKYGDIVKEVEVSRGPADVEAIIKIVDNFALIEKPYLEIREYYKHPERFVWKPPERVTPEEVPVIVIKMKPYGEVIDKKGNLWIF